MGRHQVAQLVFVSFAWQHCVRSESRYFWGAVQQITYVSSCCMPIFFHLMLYSWYKSIVLLMLGKQLCHTHAPDACLGHCCSSRKIKHLLFHQLEFRAILSVRWHHRGLSGTSLHPHIIPIHIQLHPLYKSPWKTPPSSVPLTTERRGSTKN